MRKLLLMIVLSLDFLTMRVSLMIFSQKLGRDWMRALNISQKTHSILHLAPLFNGLFPAAQISGRMCQRNINPKSSFKLLIINSITTFSNLLFRLNRHHISNMSCFAKNQIIKTCRRLMISLLLSNRTIR